MADIISRSRQTGGGTGNDGGAGNDRREWSLITGVIASVLALAYLAAGLHGHHIVSAAGSEEESPWFPLELFVIAVSPALVGFIFLWSERHLQSNATQMFLRNIGIFGFGMALAAWVAFVLK
jgi:hypothetical protein